MYPHQLIGKKAIRTKEVKFSWGAIDRSIMTNPVVILAVTESHIVAEHCEGCISGVRSILSYEWIDNNWTSYDDLMKLTDPAYVELMKSVNESRKEQ